MKLRLLLALVAAALIGAAASQALSRSAPKPCNGQQPCIEMSLNSAYNATALKLLCLYQPDLDNKPQLFCGPPQAKTSMNVSITTRRIEVVRISGSKVKTLLSVSRY
jgi:hypothetical protein